jgi:hypothetical protein
MNRTIRPRRAGLWAGLFLLPLGALSSLAAAGGWQPGARVIVEKAGTGRRAIVLRAEESRCFVAYEGADERFDEWVDPSRIRGTRPAPAAAAAAPEEKKPVEARLTEAPEKRGPAVAPLPRILELPRPSAEAVVTPAWLEPLPRADGSESGRFNTAQLALPRFKFGAVAGIASAKAPLRAVLLRHAASPRPWGFAAIEDATVAVYQRDEKAGFARGAELDLAGLGSFAPEVLQAGDLNGDGETDLVVAGGPVAQVYFGSSAKVFTPAQQPYRGKEPVRFAATGRFFAGSLPWGLGVVEGYNRFRLLTAVRAGVTPAGPAFEVKFDRITSLAAGDFDGDGFSDLALATENNGRSTGAWMFFNQRDADRPFLWPVGGKDDFARDLCAADLDHDGRADLIMTDNDAERGERIRVAFGAAGRAGWEDPWELIGSEFGVGLGTASIIVGDFNQDGRADIGVAGRNGLRVHLGADYRRFSRNPLWPRLIGAGDLPEQFAFLAGDFTGSGATDLLGYTPAFATGYNLLLNATPATIAGVVVPPPLVRKAPVQADSTVAKVEGSRTDTPPGAPVLRYLASRAEPYGQYRYRIVVEVAALADGVVGALEAVCKHEGPDTPLEEVPATCTRQGDAQWFIEVILPRGRTYRFTVTARDDQGRPSEPLRVSVSP